MKTRHVVDPTRTPTVRRRWRLFAAVPVTALGLMTLTGCGPVLSGTNYIGDGVVVATATCNPGEEVFAVAKAVNGSQSKSSSRMTVCRNGYAWRAELLYVWPYDQVTVSYDANAQYPSAWIRVASGATQSLRPA